MRIFTCEPEWEAMLTCIFEAFESGLGHKNIKLLLEPVGQVSFLDEYVHVDADPSKADRLSEAIVRRISYEVYTEMAYTAMAFEEDVLDNIYHVLILGFHYGPEVLRMVKFADIMRNREIRARVVREAERFREILRFHRVGNVYIAHFEPKSRVVGYLGPIFSDRMPSEFFVIVDDIHREAVIHGKNEHFYIQKLTDVEFENLLHTEEENDKYTDLWKVFFDSVAIKERANEKCQRNHFPLWARKHAVEFHLT
ncbi:MAG: TIGR03915 family putative DNA repair protein [Lachnospiraceae bacterium]|jgi:probable DNA metabolism protein|nr:TIGR03915 family putative DNA repair protein [Lachnospiraceae bacterium]